MEIFVEPVREHRFVVVFRGDGLGDAVNDTDPQMTGHAPLQAKGADAASQKTAAVVNEFVAQAGKVLKDDAPTNMVTLRGFARYPKIETFAGGLRPEGGGDRGLPDVQGPGPAGRHGRGGVRHVA